MIAQLFSFVFILFSSLIVGAFIQKLAGWRINLYYDFLIGFAISNSFFTIISLFHSINHQIVIAFVCILVLIFLSNFKWLSTYFRNIYRKCIVQLNENLLGLALVLTFVLVAFSRSMYQPSLHHDAGLYHIQTIKWISQYPTIYGLANLHARFGFNSNIFSWYAASNFSLLFNQPIYSINFTLVCSFLVWVYLEILSVLKTRSYLLAGSYLLIIYNLIFYCLLFISTTNNIIPVFVLITITLLSVTKLKKNPALIFPLIIISVYSITVKLSAVPLLLLVFIVFFSCKENKNFKLYFTTILLSCIIIVPWLIKNVLLSGWLIFPLSAIDIFDYDWKVPVETVNQTKLDILQYSQELNSTGKFSITNWALKKNISDILVIGLTISGVFALIFKFYTKRLYINQYHLTAIIISILGIIFLFSNAPDLSYGISFFIVVIILSIKALNIQNKNYKYGFNILWTLLFLFFIKNNWYHPWHFMKNINSRLLVPYPLEKRDKKKFGYIVIDNKIKCFYPISNDQCDDHSLPCATSIKGLENLQLRGDSINQGFYIKKINH